MADDALDAEALRRDRQRYDGFLVHTEQQLAAGHERIEHLQQAIEALDRLLALAEGSRAAASAPKGTGASLPPGADPPPPPAARKRKASRASAPRAPSRTTTPAAPVDPPPAAPSASGPAERDAAAADAPKGTDALRTLFDSEPSRTWSLSELLDALGSRGWLPASRRPEEGVRISLKRLVERGGAARTDDGRWTARSEGEAPAAPSTDERWPPAEEPDPAVLKATAAPEAAPPPPPPPPSAPRAASFGLPVGSTVTEL